MLFTHKHFAELKNLDDDMRRIIAKIANNYIDNNHTLIFGTRYSDGSLEGFSTTNEKGNRHCGMLVGIEEMGIIPLDDKSIHVEELSPGDQAIADRKYREELERENRVHREAEKARNKPRPIGERL